MAKVTHVELQYSNYDTDKEEMQVDKFVESLEFLNESIFAEAIDWKYERVHTSSGNDYFKIYGGRMASYMPFTVDVELQVCTGFCADDIDMKFKQTIFDKLSANDNK